MLRLVLCTSAMAVISVAAAAAQSVPSRVSLYLASGQLDPIAARSSKNVAYYSSLLAGTPSKQFTVCIDTGSSDLWLPSYRCNDSACTFHNQYNPYDSSTADSSSQQRVDIVYGTGQAIGFTDSDIISIGQPPVVTPNQSFAEMYRVSRDFLTSSCDGLYGLGFPSISAQGVLPPFFTMLSQNALPAPQFSIWLNPNITSLSAGELMFGGYDPSHFTGPLQTIPLSQEGYWQVPLTGAAVVSQPVQLQATAAILDSGAIGIIMSDTDANTINQQVPALQYITDLDTYTVPCDQVNALPAITFQLGGIDFAVPASAWITETSNPIGTSSNKCASSIFGGVRAEDPVVLGDNFLRAWFSVYTYNETGSSVSLAQATALTSNITDVVSAAGR